MTTNLGRRSMRCIGRNCESALYAEDFTADGIGQEHGDNPVADGRLRKHSEA